VFSRHTAPGLAVIGVLCCSECTSTEHNGKFRYDNIVVRRAVSHSVVKNHKLSNVTLDDPNLFYPLFMNSYLLMRPGRDSVFILCILTVLF
jgi:hypothetical protein